MEPYPGAADSEEKKTDAPPASRSEFSGRLPEQEQAPGYGLMFLAGMLAFGGMGLAGYGVSVLYGEPAKIVGGDAYNYIVGALRGVGLICAGLVVIGVALVCGVAGVRAKL